MAAPGGREIGRISVRVLPDTSRLRNDLLVSLRAVESRARLNVPVALDTTGLTAHTRAAVAQAQRSVRPVRVRAEVNNRDLVRVALRFRRLGERIAARFATTFRVLTSVFTRAIGGTALTVLAVAAGAAVVQLLALAGSAAQLAGALALIPAAGLAAAAGIAVLVVGMQGFGAALSAADPAELAEALKNLTPNARAAALALRGLRPVLSDLRKQVQERLFAGLAAEIRPLATTIIPTLGRGLSGVAAQAGAAGREVLRFLRAPATLRDTVQSLTFTQRAFAALVPAVQPALQIIRDLGVVGSSFLPRLAAGLTTATQRLARFVANARATGQLAEFIQTGLDAVRDLARAAFAAGRVITGLVRAAQAAGGNSTLGALADGLERVADVVNSAQAHNTLVTLFAGLLDGARALGPALSALGHTFVVLVPGIAALARAAGSTLAGLLTEIAQTIAEPQVRGGLSDAVNGLLAGIRALTPAVAPLGQALAALGRTFGELARLGGSTLAEVLTRISEVVATPQVQGGLAEILTGLLAGLRALLPALPPIAEAFVALAPAAAQFAEAAGKILAGALTTLADHARHLAPLLEAVGGFLNDHGEIIGRLAPVVIAAALAFGAMNRSMQTLQAGSGVVGVVGRLAGGFNNAAVAQSAFSGKAGTLGGVLRTAATGVVTLTRALAAQALVLLTNPVFLVVAGLVALGAALVIAWQRSETFRSIVTGTWEALRTGALAVLNFFKDNWAPILGTLVAGPIGLAVGLAVKHFDTLKRAFLVVVSAAGAFAARVVGFFAGLAAGAGRAMFQTTAFVAGLPRRALAALGNIGVLLLQAGRNMLVGPGLLGGATGAVGRLLGFFRGLPGTAIRALGNVGRILFDSGKRLIQGFIDGIVSMVGSVKDAVGNVLSGARNLLPFSPAKEGPFSGRGWTLYSGRSLIEGLVDGLESRYRHAIGSLTGFTDTLAATLAVPPDAGFAPITATGVGAAAVPVGPGTVALHPEDRRLLLAVAERPVSVRMDGRELGRAVRTQQLREQRR